MARTVQSFALLVLLLLTTVRPMLHGRPAAEPVEALAVYVDSSLALDFESVRALAHVGAFETVRSTPSFRYDDVAVWLRVPIEGLEEDRLLKVANPSIDSLRLFRPLGDGSWEVLETGDGYPFDTREVSSRSFLFRIPPAADDRTFYLRAASRGPLYVPIEILGRADFWTVSSRELLGLGLFFGIMLAMALYHLVLYVSIRDRAYLYYVAFILMLLAYEVGVERIGFAYLWPQSVWWAERSNTTLGLLAVATGIQFSRSFLQTHEYVPKWNRYLLLLCAIAVVLIGVNLAGMHAAVVYMTIAFVLLSIISLVVVGVAALRRGNASARYYLLAWSFLLAGVMVWTLGFLHVIDPDSIARRISVQVGASLEVVLFALGLGYRYNEMRTARERLRLRIASDLHDEVGSSLTQISLATNRLKRQVDAAAAGAAEEIGAVARSLSTTMRDIVWTLEPGHDSWDAMQMRMKDYAAHMLGPADIRFDMQGRPPGGDARLPPDVRNNLLLLYKEVLHNVVKHAKASEVAVRWRLDRHRLIISLRDDGRGFEPATVTDGSGLSSMKRRAEAMGADFRTKTAPGAGTSMELSIPL